MSGYMAQRLQKKKLSLPSWRSAQAKTNSYFQLQLPHRELIMMSLISQASRQQFIQQSFPAVMRMQGGLPATMPRVVVRDQRLQQQFKRPDKKTLEQRASQIIPKKLSVARTIPSTSNVLPPSKIVYISEEEMSKFAISNTFDEYSLQFPVGARGKDCYVPGQVKIQIRMPGDQPFKYVRRANYDMREFKYLWVLHKDPFAVARWSSAPDEDIASKISYEPLMGIAREMTPTDSERGIVCHPKIAKLGYFGGEVWFLPRTEKNKGNKYDAVHINLNSGRFPSKDDKNLYTAAKYWLSLGYHKVFVTPRDQRYGEVTPILFMKESKAEAQSKTKPQAKPFDFV